MLLQLAANGLPKRPTNTWWGMGSDMGLVASPSTSNTSSSFVPRTEPGAQHSIHSIVKK